MSDLDEYKKCYKRISSATKAYREARNHMEKLVDEIGEKLGKQKYESSYLVEADKHEALFLEMIGREVMKEG